MESKEDLIYNLIFSLDKEFEIDISSYIKKVYKYEDFISEIKTILFKSKVMLVSEEIELVNKNIKVQIIWRIKVKK